MLLSFQGEGMVAEKNRKACLPSLAYDFKFLGITSSDIETAKELKTALYLNHNSTGFTLG